MNLGPFYDIQSRPRAGSKISEENDSINGDEISKTIPSQEVKNSITALKPNEELVSILPKRLSIKDIFISIVNESN